MGGKTNKAQIIRWERIPDVIIAPTRAELDKKYLHRGRTPNWLKAKMSETGKTVARGWWPEEKRIEVVASYAVLGKVKDVAAVTMVPEGTILRWMTEEWWHEVMSRVRAQKDEELDVKFTKVVDKAVDAIIDRVENGDFAYNSRTQEVYRKPISARDAATVTNIIVDKRNLLRGMPTSRVERTNTATQLEKLAEEFKKFAKSRTINAHEITGPESMDVGQQAENGEEVGTTYSQVEETTKAIPQGAVT